MPLLVPLQTVLKFKKWSGLWSTLYFTRVLRGSHCRRHACLLNGLTDSVGHQIQYSASVWLVIGRAVGTRPESAWHLVYLLIAARDRPNDIHLWCDLSLDICDRIHVASDVVLLCVSSQQRSPSSAVNQQSTCVIIIIIIISSSILLQSYLLDSVRVEEMCL